MRRDTRSRFSVQHGAMPLWGTRAGEAAMHASMALDRDGAEQAAIEACYQMWLGAHAGDVDHVNFYMDKLRFVLLYNSIARDPDLNGSRRKRARK